MTIELIGGGSASASALRTAEAYLGVRLPPAYVDFVREHDGCRPPSNEFPIGDSMDDADSVVRFVPVAEASNVASTIGLPAKMWPVARAEGGNYVLLDLSAGEAVKYWDHETGELALVAANFRAFLSLLRPFDPSQVELDPEDVIDVWVDPEFRKEIEEQRRKKP